MLTPPRKSNSELFGLKTNPNDVATQISPVANSDYESQIGKGNIYLGGDLDQERASKMGAWEQTGKFVGNTIANSLTGIVEDAGHLYNLATQWGDDRNYTNAVIDTMNDWKNPFGEIYRENPKATFDLTDPAWWLNNASGLISSVASFAAVGMGAGSMVAKGATAISRLGLLTSEAAGVAGETTTAAMLAYTEGAMSARTVFTDVYQKQYDKAIAAGLSHEEADSKAKHAGAQGASTTAQLNTVYGTLLNLGSIAPMFKDFKATREFFRNGAGKLLAGESKAAWATRLAAITEHSPEVAHLVGHGGYKHLLAEAGKEGFEEVMNQYTQATGTDTGNDGKSGNIFSQFKEVLDMQKTLDKTWNENGLLNFVLGAVGGVGNTMVMEHTPMPHSKLNEDGSLVPKMDKETGKQLEKNGKPVFEKTFYSSRFLDTNKRFRTFDNAREAILSDVKTVGEMRDAIDKAVIAGDSVKAKQLSDKLLSINHLNAILNGTSKNWVAEYESYRNLDNTKDLSEPLFAQADELSKQQNDLLTQYKEVNQMPEEAQQTFKSNEAEITNLRDQANKVLGETEATTKGFALSKTDNAYKEKATQAITDLHEANRLYEETKNQFKGWTEEDMAYNLVPTVVAKKLDDMYNKRAIKDFEPIVAEAGLKVSADKSALIQMHSDFQTLNTLAISHNAFTDPINNNDTANLKELLKANSVEFQNTDKGILKAAKEYTARLGKDLKVGNDSLKEQEDNINNSDEFLKWQKDNKAGNWKDYVTHIMENNIEASDYADSLKQLTQLKRDSLENKLELDDIRKSPDKYVRSMMSDVRTVNERSLDLDKFLATEESKRRYENEAFRDKAIESRSEQITELNSNITETENKLDALSDKILVEEANKTKDPIGTAIKLQQLLTERNLLKKTIQQDKLQKMYLLAEVKKILALVLQSEETPNIPTSELIINSAEEVAAERPQKNIILENHNNIVELVDTYGLNKEAIMGELNGYILNPEKFPKLIKETYKSTSQAQQAQLYQYTKAMVENYKAIKTEIAEVEEEAVYGSKVFDENDMEAEAILKPLKPIVASTSPIKLVKNVTATSNVDGSHTIFIGQGKGQPRIVINRKARGRGFSYTVNEGLIDGEVLTGNNAKTIASYYLEEEGTSLSEVGEKLDAKTSKKESRVKDPIPDTEESEFTPEETAPNPVISPSLLMNPNIELDLEGLVGAKRLSALSPIANHLAYLEITRKNGVTTRENATNELNKDANLKVLVPGYLSIGDVVKYELEEGTTTKQAALMTYEDGSPLYSPNDAEGLENDANQVPIKITNSKGDTIGHVMTVSKLNEQVGGKYANVEVLENFEESQVEKAENAGIRSIEDLNKELKELRTAVLDNHNKEQKVSSKIEQIGKGMPIYNTVLQKDGGSELSEQSASTLLPSKELRLVTVVNGVVYPSHSDSIDIMNPQDATSYLGVLLPTVAQEIIKPTASDSTTEEIRASNLYFSPLETNKLNDYQVNTMWQALLLYTDRNKASSKAQIAKIKALTGFDLSMGIGLRAFINQYYVNPQNFTVNDLVGNEYMPNLVLSISDGLVENQKERADAKIKIAIKNMPANMLITGTAVRNKVIYITRADGTINPEFEQVFKVRMKEKVLQASHTFKTNTKAGLAKYGTAKDFNGLNSKGEIVELVYKDGEFNERKRHADYNSYIKNNSNTIINGTNKVDDTHVYFVHPQIAINTKYQVGNTEINEYDSVDTNTLEPIQNEDELVAQKAKQPNSKHTPSSLSTKLDTQEITDAEFLNNDQFGNC